MIGVSVVPSVVKDSRPAGKYTGGCRRMVRQGGSGKARVRAVAVRRASIDQLGDARRLAVCRGGVKRLRIAAIPQEQHDMVGSGLGVDERSGFVAVLDSEPRPRARTPETVDAVDRRAAPRASGRYRRCAGVHRADFRRWSSRPRSCRQTRGQSRQSRVPKRAGSVSTSSAGRADSVNWSGMNRL
jgi:hypothetical protein